MKKSEIRKKILKTRKQKSSENLEISFKNILEILKKTKISSKIVGAYYPYNYEFDVTKILKEFEKQKFKVSLPKIKKTFKWIFFIGQQKIH